MTISRPRFRKGYISVMWNRYIDLQIKPITFNRWSNKMTGVPVLTIWRRHCLILPFMIGTILTPERFSPYYQVPIISKILAEPVLYDSSILRKSHFSAQYYNSYIMWEKPMSAECAEVSSLRHSVMYQKISDFPSLDNHSINKLKTTGDPMFMDWCSDRIRVHAKQVYLLNFRIDYCTTVNHFTALHLLSIWEFIVR